MKSLVPVVAVLVVVLAISVQEVQLVSNWGRRFGRSLDKKYSKGRIHTPQMQFHHEEKFPRVQDEDGGCQHFNEHLPVGNIQKHCFYLKAPLSSKKGKEISVLCQTSIPFTGVLGQPHSTYPSRKWR